MKCGVEIDPPENKKGVQNKWVFCLKRGNYGEVRYKARLVAKGFTQQKGIDYLKTISPVVRYSTVRLLFVLVVQFNLENHHLDVETAFLHGEIDQEIYMSKPEEFVKNQDKVCLLKNLLS